MYYRNVTSSKPEKLVVASVRKLVLKPPPPPPLPSLWRCGCRARGENDLPPPAPPLPSPSGLLFPTGHRWGDLQRKLCFWILFGTFSSTVTKWAVQCVISSLIFTAWSAHDRGVRSCHWKGCQHLPWCNRRIYWEIKNEELINNKNAWALRKWCAGGKSEPLVYPVLILSHAVSA